MGIHKVIISSKSKNYDIHTVSKIIIKDYPSVVIKPKYKGYPHFRFVKKGAKIGDGYTLFASYPGGPVMGMPRGVYVYSSRMAENGRLHVKVLKAKFYFRNNKNGKYITRWVTKPYQEYSPIYGYLVGSHARTPLIKGYTPAYVKAWYKLF